MTTTPPAAPTIQPIAFEDELKRSFLDYSMSVIVSRALPDVRDGLKPVQRRILFAMYELGNLHNKAYKKSARVVGDVIGKYHPHGDDPVYEALVRMAQDFSLRHPLVDGQGNFGSLDGDPPAAMRYTEVRMARIAEELLSDIEKDTVEFSPNYDGSLREPRVFPARIPNLLINGSTGIAVGMATEVPPHNLGEVVDALVHLITHPEAELKDLLKFVKGPDFPTAGIIHGAEGLKEAYATGRGRVNIRARARIEKHEKGGRESIVITEIPYQVNKARILETMAHLVQNKKIEGISDVRDESDRDGIRVVVDLKRDAPAQTIMNQLYHSGGLDQVYNFMMVALVGGRPELVNLHGLLSHFIRFRKEMVSRRCLYELRKAEEKAHILEGLKICIDHLDAIIKLIRSSKGPAEAKEGLMSRFKLTDVQAQAILDMRLQKLTQLEREKLLADYKETLKEINRLKEILSSEKLLLNVVREELLEVRERYADPRRTEIVEKAEQVTTEDLIVEEDMVVTISHQGYIKRNPLSLYRAQRRGGRGKIGMKTREEDFAADVFVASTKDYLLIFTDRGRVYWLKVHKIPQAGRATRGAPIVSLVNFEPGELTQAIINVREFEDDKYVMMATRDGMIKKTPLSAFSNPMSRGIIALKLKEKDALVGVAITDGKSEVILASDQGKAIRFKETDVRPMGRSAAGVRALRLKGSAKVLGMAVSVDPKSTVLTVTQKGYGKRSHLEDYRLQTRGGGGVININVTPRTGDPVDIRVVTDEDDLMLITSKGTVLRIRAKDVRVTGRSTQGVRAITLEEGEVVSAVARLAEKDDEENGAGGGES
ncbi:MAG: DNA gyrase subunit A [Nitrospirae bacterium]|nr:DNA gyrase subunit A [Nitrospirota bacterium]